MNIDIKENFLETEKMVSKIKNKKRNRIMKIVSFSVVFLVTGFVIFSSQVMVSEQSSTSWFSQLPIIKQFKHLAESADRQLKGENNDRINILLLGMGGRKHEGGYLTDTLILASIEPSTKKVSLVSIPRDMAIPIENMGWKKINSVNAFAEMEQEGSGGVAISQTLSDILNIPIDYYLRIDFEGFVNIVDELGGVTVNVENTINDREYPVRGMEDAENYSSRYEHLYIEKGVHTMDGELALKYVRSRHTPGVEGSDFARAKRQQNVIEAVKDNILSVKTIFKPKMIAEIIDQFQEHISTNLKVWEMVKLWEITKDIKRENISNKVLDNGPNGLLIDTFSSEGAYILVPRSGDFSEIEYFVNNIFSDAPKQDKNSVFNEGASIEIRNGTWINGLASKTSLDLEKYGFTIIRVGNSSRKDFQKTVIYDLTYGDKAKSLSILKSRTDANVSFGLPDWLMEDIKKDIQGMKNPPQPDFVIILGQNADTTKSGIPNPNNLQE